LFVESRIFGSVEQLDYGIKAVFTDWLDGGGWLGFFVPIIRYLK